jgi:hypothetical protein
MSAKTSSTRGARTISFIVTNLKPPSELMQDMDNRIGTPDEMSIRPMSCILQATQASEFSDLQTNYFP